MKIELYDIIKLDDNKEYSVIRKIEADDKEYFLLTEVDSQDEPNFDNIRIVEKVDNDEIAEIEDESLLKELGEEFMELLSLDM